MNVSQIVAQVRSEASNVDPAKAALTVLAAPLYVVGLVAGGTVRVLWTVVTWLWAAGLVGFRVARGRN